MAVLPRGAAAGGELNHGDQDLRPLWTIKCLVAVTTYPIPSFWQLAENCGFTPELVHLVPKNQLDERYAYFLLTKDGAGPVAAAISS